MVSAMAIVCVLAAGPWTGQEVRSLGYLWSVDNQQACPYELREGDLILATSKDKFYSVIWTLARTGHPYHSALVVRRSSGELEVFEVGGAGARSSTLRHPVDRLTALMQEYAGHDPAAWVRQRRVPLTPDESARLTRFAETQVGKGFVTNQEFGRMVLPRGRSSLSGGIDQSRWFCSELIVGAMVYAGLLPEPTPNPGRIMPRDMFFDSRIDLSGSWNPPLRWTGDRTPPQRFEGQPPPP